MAFIANSQLVNLILDQCLSTDEKPPNESLGFLYDQGFFTPEPYPLDEYQHTGIQYDAVILFLANQCNLSCTYCYASSGEFEPSFMKWKVAKSAIDYLLAHAQNNNAQSVTLGFHGGGEPTMNWRTLTRAVEYMKQEAKRRSLFPNISGSFNGYWSGKKLDFILENFTELSMSFDGIPMVQNLQRPASDNKESFSIVCKTLKALNHSSIRYGIRMTVTDESVNHLAEGVSFICDNFWPGKIQVEPVFLEGRARRNGSSIKSAEKFISQFIKSHEIAENNNIELFYSGARANVLTSRFCLAACRAFVVTPEGDVTTCFETYGRSHPLSERFIVGGYNGAGFVMDPVKLKNHFSRKVDDIPYCESCFCKWHCAGDCAIKTVSSGKGGSFEPSERCVINRELTLYFILRNIKRSGGLIWTKT